MRELTNEEFINMFVIPPDFIMKARPERARQHPAHPEYEPLPVTQKELDELNKVQTELKEIRHKISKTIHDYLELYED